jgi:hypothetical protein
MQAVSCEVAGARAGACSRWPVLICADQPAKIAHAPSSIDKGTYAVAAACSGVWTVAACEVEAALSLLQAGAVDKILQFI